MSTSQVSKVATARSPEAFSPTNVIFLGAGSSWCAGYPLARDLVPAIERDVEATSSANLKGLWKPWKEYTDEVRKRLDPKDPIARLILNPNPEIALSVFDLMEAALRGEDADAEKAGVAMAREDMVAGVKILEDHYGGEARKELARAGRAKKFLVGAMEWFFFEKHAALRQQPMASRAYLRDLLDGIGLGHGDAVITTNWDAVAELTLGEVGLWNPFDGYGFQRQLVNGLTRPDGSPVPFRPGMPTTSPVKILKLHGSFGWKEKHDGLYLDHREFLYHLPFRYESDYLTFKDREGPEFPGRDDPVLLYPSFLKRLYTRELHEVWLLAGEAVRSCKRFVVAGYSLPEADVSVRTLLVPLRARAEAREVDVEVHDPSDQTLRRWQEFLGGNIQEYRGGLCDTLDRPPTLLE